MNIEISKKELQKRSIFIATPMYGGMCTFTYLCGMCDVIKEMVLNNITYKTSFLANESLIPRARNYLTDSFMRSGCTHMMFIDADIGFKGQDVMSLLALSDPNSDKDIIVGAYPKKCFSWEKIKLAVDKGFADKDPRLLEQFVGDYVFNVTNNTKEIPLDGLTEISEGGTGFMMIQRKALEKFADRYPQYLYTPDHARSKDFNGSRKIVQYFHSEINPADNRYLSEDYWFSLRMREIGYKIWLAPWINLSHTGTYEYKGNLKAIASVGASPTIDKK